MIDFERENLVTMTEAAKLLPGRPNLASLWRWRRVGVAGVKLEVVCVGGGRTYTSREALARFLERVTAARNGEPISSQPNRRRQAEQETARRHLRDAGLID